MILTVMRNVLALIFVSLTALPAAARDDVLLLVVRNGDHTVRLTVEQLAALPQHSTEVQENGRTTRYEGVRLADVLAQAGVTFGQTLRGPRLASYLLAGAPDGFRAVVALPEIDPEFAERDAIVATRRDGAPLAGRDGPLRLILPSDKRHARWIRQLNSVTVLAAPDLE